MSNSEAITINSRRMHRWKHSSRN